MSNPLYGKLASRKQIGEVISTRAVIIDVKDSWQMAPKRGHL
jgi:hypothetical protein